MRAKLTGFFGCLQLTAALAGPVAFTGAEGFGRFAKGGRGGDVYQVTTLADSGPGSLREGIHSATGPRTIVFEVSGNIELKSRLVMNKSAITMAGQTAPGEGITIRDFTFKVQRATNVVIRYLRFRLGDENKAVGASGGDDAFNTEDVFDMIVDHCSFSWAIDGTHDWQRWLHPGSNYKYRGTLADWKVNTAADVGEAPRTQAALEAAEWVLARAGASLQRDAVDMRVIDDVRNRKGKVIDSQKEVGGWPILKSLPAPATESR